MAATTPEKRAYDAARYKANRETIRATHAAYNARTKEQRRIFDAARYTREREKRLAQSAAYHRANPERKKAAAARRRARLKAAAGWTYTTDVHVRGRWDMSGGKCWYCGADATTLDHRIPLVRGGSNFPANLVAACRACNIRKGARTESEFSSEIGGR